MINIKNLNRNYGKTEVLKNINLDINDHEFIVVLGPSGCGKTTFLRLIAGLDEPTGGDIVINGKPINKIKMKDRNIAMVFQDYALFPDMNVYSNIAFGLQIRKKKKQEIEKTVMDIANKLQIESLLKRKPSQLSGGEQQRVALARAMVKNPDIYLFDEPLSNLDVNLKDDFMELIKRIHDETRATFIYVTHSQNEALKLADRIVVMNKGDILQINNPKTIYNNPNSLFVANFLGEPKINILELEGSKYKLGIRPENIEIIGKGKNNDDLILQGTIERSEFLGNSYLLSVKCGESSLKTLSLNEVSNKNINISIAKKDLMVFDENGQSVSYVNINVINNKFNLEV